MVPTTAEAEVRLAGPEEADRFSQFLRTFLSANDFPFVIIHDAPEPRGQLRRVMFEDVCLTRKFAREWSLAAGTA